LAQVTPPDRKEAPHLVSDKDDIHKVESIAEFVVVIPGKLNKSQNCKTIMARVLKIFIDPGHIFGSRLDGIVP
jgi:hypothetical protein